jgi:voltage-gated potassium channel
MKRAVTAAVGRYRSEILLAALVAAMLASPMVDHHPRIGALIACIQLLLLFAAANYLANRKIVRKVGLPIGVVWLIARLLEAFGDSRHAYTHLAPLAGFALSCSILWALLSRFGSISKVTSSVISEAIISYLVMAVAFSQLYWILDHFIGNAFNQTIPLGQNETFLYFSMITLSGVGYGGILPINSYVRLVAAFENITGVFYLAVVVARVVSSYRSRTHPPDARQ